MTRKTKAKAASAAPADAKSEAQVKPISRILAVMSEFRVPETEIMRLINRKTGESA